MKQQFPTYVTHFGICHVDRSVSLSLFTSTQQLLQTFLIMMVMTIGTIEIDIHSHVVITEQCTLTYFPPPWLQNSHAHKSKDKQQHLARHAKHRSTGILQLCKQNLGAK